jgi:hypothetical protein
MLIQMRRDHCADRSNSIDAEQLIIVGAALSGFNGPNGPHVWPVQQLTRAALLPDDRRRRRLGSYLLMRRERDDRQHVMCMRRLE